MPDPIKIPEHKELVNLVGALYAVARTAPAPAETHEQLLVAGKTLVAALNEYQSLKAAQEGDRDEKVVPMAEVHGVKPDPDGRPPVNS